MEQTTTRGNKTKKLKASLKPGHTIHTLISEHEKILGFLSELEKTNQSIQKMKSYREKKEFQKLKNIAHHLIEAEPHHRREEEVLFPEIEKKGIFCAPEMMREEHKELRKYKKKLEQLAKEAAVTNFNTFKKELDRTVNSLLQVLGEHIFKENNILYPMALEVIQDKKLWEKIKSECDKIGYCCFTPKA